MTSIKNALKLTAGIAVLSIGLIAQTPATDQQPNQTPSTPNAQAPSSNQSQPAPSANQNQPAQSQPSSQTPSTTTQSTTTDQSRTTDRTTSTDTNTTDNTNNNGKMPKTASELPLIGALGSSAFGLATMLRAYRRRRS